MVRIYRLVSNLFLDRDEIRWFWRNLEFIEDLANVLKLATTTQMQLTMIPLNNNLDATRIIEIIAQSTLDSLQIGILHDFDCPNSDKILKAVIHSTSRVDETW